MSELAIETQNLTVYYGKQRGILNLNLQVLKGEIYGFLGPNGAGKTTTIRTLLDLIRPVSGKAYIFGWDCRKNGTKIRQSVGYLPGELALYENITALEYLTLICNIRGRREDIKYALELCERLDFDPYRKISQYSRGNRQKIGVISAFMNKPDLLILDEPTTGLDPLIQRTVLDMVREAKANGHTVFFSSHILPEVQAICDRAGIIRKGKLIAVEKIEDLLNQHFRRVRIRFGQSPEPAALEVEGVKLVERDENILTFEVTQNMQDFITRATQFTILDLETLPVSLEDIFLTYYGINNNGGKHV